VCSKCGRRGPWKPSCSCHGGDGGKPLIHPATAVAAVAGGGEGGGGGGAGAAMPRASSRYRSSEGGGGGTSGGGGGGGGRTQTTGDPVVGAVVGNTQEAKRLRQR